MSTAQESPLSDIDLAAALVERLGLRLAAKQLGLPASAFWRHVRGGLSAGALAVLRSPLPAAPALLPTPKALAKPKRPVGPTPENRVRRDRPLAIPLVAEGSELLKRFINDQLSSTALVYHSILKRLARINQAETLDAAIQPLLRDKVEAHTAALAYLTMLRAKGQAPKTIERDASALRSLNKMARRMGLCSFELEIESKWGGTVRDTRGPGVDMVRQMLDVAKAQGPRDYAILRLFSDMALRCCEVAELEMEHVNLDKGEISILGKGRVARERLSLPLPTKEALRAYLAKRGTHPGMLWKGRNSWYLSTRSLYHIVRKIGRKLGVKAWPHGLRHTAITHALDVTNGDVRKVRQFSRHKSLDMLLTYDDARQDQAGAMASLVANGNNGKVGKKLSHLHLLRQIKAKLEGSIDETARECLALIEQGGVV